jgi:DNA primase
MSYNIAPTVEDYLKLYDQGVSIHDLKPQVSKDYISFITKVGKPVKLISKKKSLRYIPYDTQYFKFYQKHKLFWMIPVEVPSGKVVGFLLKGYNQSEYRTIKFNQYSLLFGLANFRGYQKNKLIILTEGSRDCMYLQKIYPFTLGLLTARLTAVTLEIIKHMTNRVLLILDTDSAGQKQTAINKKLLQKNRVAVITMPIPYDLKDPGEYFMTSDKNKLKFESQVKRAIRPFT